MGHLHPNADSASENRSAPPCPWCGCLSAAGARSSKTYCQPRTSAPIVHPDLQCRSGLTETWAKSLYRTPARQKLSVRHDVEAVGAQYTLHPTLPGLPWVISSPLCNGVDCRLACLVENRPVRCSRHAAPVASDTGLEYATRISIALAGRLLPTRRGHISTPPPRAVCGQAPPCSFCPGRSFAPCLEF